MSIMMTRTTSAKELDALKLQLEALNHALQEKDNQIVYLMNKLDRMTGKSQMSKKDESVSKVSTPPKETSSKETLEKGFKLNADGSISTIQLKELIKEALKD
ncbi:hypothetical protein JCGZ_05216 [Jatropha curcas]|uniref:EF-hand domain-containing protein n=1 Tax=Jatropha curcas TaxID=180498 RepID=A0A067KNF3_JATCU|nr:hypothetical protein JCGZ_05216 [Jatropha curcas]